MEKTLLPVTRLFLGQFKSVAMLLRIYKEQLEFCLKMSQRYSGDTSCKDLKTIIFDLPVISYSMVLNPCLSISSLLGVLKLLLVKILATLC